MSSRDDIVEKIRALKRMTIANGCSEAEAETALRMISSLMARHQVSEAETASVESEFRRKDRAMRGVSPTISRCHAARFAVGGIQAYTDTQIGFGFHRLVIIGLPHNIEIAEYLWEMLVSIIDAAWLAHRASLPALPKTKAVRKVLRKSSQSFKIGMADRLGRRLSEMAEDRKREVRTATSGHGRDVVLANELALHDAYKALCPESTAGGRASKPIGVISAAFSIGSEVGAAAAIKLGVAASSPGTRALEASE